MKDYKLFPEGVLTYTFEGRVAVLDDLSNKLGVVGGNCIRGQYLNVFLKPGANTNNVKSILRKHFGMKAEVRLADDCKSTYFFISHEDVIKLCKIFLGNNRDLSYRNRFDPLGVKDTVFKVVYQYGQVRYDLLAV